jgi:inorganic pyrophosphatase
VSDLAGNVLDEIERFFVFYNRQKEVVFKPLGRRGSAQAKKLLAQGQRLFRKSEKKKG